MQTHLTDKNFLKSANNLNRQHLQANIYESIHILASLLNVNDRLVNPKRSVGNHPVAKLWKGYEKEMLCYVDVHMVEWERRGYKLDINKNNWYILLKGIWKDGFEDYQYYMYYHDIPSWITDELIQTHRSVLIQKEIKKDTKRYERDQLFHYRNLWPNCPTNLEMKYDWRNKA